MGNNNDTLNVFADGGSRGNPGPAASGFVVKKNGRTIGSGKKFLGEATNNFAEYMSVIIALEWLIENEKSQNQIIFFLDSELVTKQINGEYKIKSKNLIPLSIKARELLRSFEKRIMFNHLTRDKNKEADALVNEALDQNT